MEMGQGRWRWVIVGGGEESRYGYIEVIVFPCDLINTEIHNDERDHLWALGTFTRLVLEISSQNYKFS